MGGVRNWLKPWWPCLAVLLLLWSMVATILHLSFRMNEGHLVYALDDSYIHMAIAKNFARHGVWGVTPFGFTATSSSPLWTLLIAASYRVFGVNTPTPLILNILFATLLVIAVQWILVSTFPALPSPYGFLVLVCLLFFTPVSNLIFTGLEHILHTVLTLLFAFQASRILAGNASPACAPKLALLALGIAVSAVRYEGLFAVGVVAALLFAQRRLRLSVELAFWSILPGLVMGVISVKHGWFWLPNSVALKGNLPLAKAHPAASFLAHAMANTAYTGMRVVRLEGVALLLMLWRYAQNKEGSETGVLGPEHEAMNPDPHRVQMWLLGTFVATATLHLALARTGWFYRYEAYLVAWGLTAVAVPLWEFLRSLGRTRRFLAGDVAGLAGVALLLFSTNLFCTAGYDALRMTLPALHDTFRWHYQMGSFVKRYYQGSALVVNDIGAVNFLADIHCTDPHGLADQEIGRALLRGHTTSEFLDRLARSRGVRAALVDDNWLGVFGGVPRTWVLAGVWRFQNRVVLAPPGLSFYALDQASKLKLIQNLRDYSRFLPPDVEQLGPYIQPVRE